MGQKCLFVLRFKGPVNSHVGQLVPAINLLDRGERRKFVWCLVGMVRVLLIANNLLEITKMFFRILKLKHLTHNLYVFL